MSNLPGYDPYPWYKIDVVQYRTVKLIGSATHYEWPAATIERQFSGGARTVTWGVS